MANNRAEKGVSAQSEYGVTGRQDKMHRHTGDPINFGAMGMMRSLKNSNRLLAGFVLAIGFLLVSCDTPSGLAPEQNDTTARLAASQSRPLQRVRRRIVVAKGGKQITGSSGGTASKWIKAKKGGKLKYLGHMLKFPKNALPQDTLISITVLPGDFIDVDFGPDGHFNQEVTVRLSYKDADLTGIDENNLTMAWIDDATGELVEIPSTVHKKKKYVEAKTDHFTQYTLSTR